ncbi:MAG: SufD family Fe-S cluster assembly protein [Puniceicoccales bacterium]|jgi:Fe-S cluster assembly protein SufD|nr:SufD family Fe-S cluster assembly protein [Puniceicoccales bacterium]
MSAVDIISIPKTAFMGVENGSTFAVDNCAGDCEGALIVSVGLRSTFRYYAHLPMGNGAMTFRRHIEISLDAPGARAEIYALLNGGVGSKISLSISLAHRAMDSHSVCAVRSIGDGDGSMAIEASVYVGKRMPNCSSTVQLNNLQLSSRCQLVAIPALHIDTANSRCSHGTTVGGLDPSQIFYLRSRGLSEESSKSALCDGFCEELLRKFPKKMHKH